MALGVPDVAVGCWTDADARTGCTVVLPPAGTLGGVAVRGGAPGTREAAALGSTAAGVQCHGIVLTGGSAFGLAAADGVASWCEERGQGVAFGGQRIPVIGAAVVMDLRRPGQMRPGPEQGRAACEAATTHDPPQGSVGVGAGCTVGKAAGLEWGSAGGQGWAVTREAGVTVGALVATNALGDVVDGTGAVLAGTRAPVEAPRYPAHVSTVAVGESTVIGCLVTDARLTKPDACRAADLSHTGIARSIDPAHTSMDGDALFLLATGRVEASVDLVAMLGARVVAEAIRSSVRHASSMEGFPADPRAAG